jgi:hypothetical protein
MNLKDRSHEVNVKMLSGSLKCDYEQQDRYTDKVAFRWITGKWKGYSLITHIRCHITPIFLLS